MFPIPEEAADDAEEDEAEDSWKCDIEGLSFGSFGGRLVVNWFFIDFDADGRAWNCYL